MQFINDAFWWQQTIYSILFSHAMIKYQAISKMLSKINALQDNNHLFIYLFYLLQQATKWKNNAHTERMLCLSALFRDSVFILFYFNLLSVAWATKPKRIKKTHRGKNLTEKWTGWECNNICTKLGSNGQNRTFDGMCVCFVEIYLPSNEIVILNKWIRSTDLHTGPKDDFNK